ncbi:ABC transporter permease [Candidatus Bathyarchaeota archaeon]|nr:ABC transporter permease [Candidatus Bathyarchaeota archaeon]
MIDKSEVVINLTASAVIAYMLISVFYLYVAVGENWNLVLNALLDNRVHGAIFISVSSALLVGILAIAASIPVAYILTYSRFRGKDILETLLVDLPQTFPPVTEGLVYLLMFGRFGLAYTFAAVIIAKFYVSAPFTISFTVRRFREIKESGIDIIARSLGARTSHILSRILLPLSARDMAAGFSLTWARAMGELAATLIFAGAIPWVTETLPVLIYLASSERPQVAIAASVITETLSIISLLSFKLIARRR